MSRKAKRLRGRNRFLELRIAVLEQLRDKLRREEFYNAITIQRLQKELAQWKPQVTVEWVPDRSATRLAVHLDDMTVEHAAMDLDTLLKLTTDDMCRQLKEHFKTRRFTTRRTL